MWQTSGDFSPSVILEGPSIVYGVPTRGRTGRGVYQSRADVGRVSALTRHPPDSACYGFQTSHTRPTRSGPGVSVVPPGCQPEGMTSPVSRVCWNALI